jgi:hypothetical protein
MENLSPKKWKSPKKFHLFQEYVLYDKLALGLFVRGHFVSKRSFRQNGHFVSGHFVSGQFVIRQWVKIKKKIFSSATVNSSEKMDTSSEFFFF